MRPETLKIKLYENGKFDPLTEYEHIIWWWNQQVKTHSKKYQIAYFSSILAQHGENLNKNEAFEVLAYLNSKVSEKQLKAYKQATKDKKNEMEKERKKWRTKADQDISELELKSFDNFAERPKMLQHLLKQVRNN